MFGHPEGEHMVGNYTEALIYRCFYSDLNEERSNENRCRRWEARQGGHILFEQVPLSVHQSGTFGMTSLLFSPGSNFGGSRPRH